MKKLTISMIFMLALITPSFADFTVKDLFVSGGTSQPTESKDAEKKDHDCN